MKNEKKDRNLFGIFCACILAGVLIFALPSLIGTKESVNSMMSDTYPALSIIVKIIGGASVAYGGFGIWKLKKRNS